MAALSFEVPPSFWDDHAQASVHLRRIVPGQLEQVSTELASAFLSGSGPLSVPQGEHELVEIELAFETADGVFGIKPRLHLRRVTVDSKGFRVAPAQQPDRDLPDDERRAEQGWCPSEEEDALMKSALGRLIDENACDDDVLAEMLADLIRK